MDLIEEEHRDELERSLPSWANGDLDEDSDEDIDNPLCPSIHARVESQQMWTLTAAVSRESPPVNSKNVMAHMNVGKGSVFCLPLHLKSMQISTKK